MGEIWKPVVGWGTRYEVSNEGKVRSLDHSWANPLTGGLAHHKGKILTPVDPGNGYYRVYIGGKRPSIHRLVCEAFHGPAPEGKPLVLHGDGNPANNNAENLRWGSHEENEADKKLHGRNYELNRTHCPQNHEYTEENTRISSVTGFRTCRICSRATNQKKRDTGLPPGDPRHGTNYGYLGYKCRCDPCKKAGSEYSAQRPKKPRTTLTAEETATRFIAEKGRFPNRKDSSENGTYRKIYWAKKNGAEWAVKLWEEYRS